jgi:hypothetical protein
MIYTTNGELYKTSLLLSPFEKKLLIKTLVANNINAKDYYSLV